jgi:hypothetical protein
VNGSAIIDGMLAALACQPDHVCEDPSLRRLVDVGLDCRTRRRSIAVRCSGVYKGIA